MSSPIFLVESKGRASFAPTGSSVRRLRSQSEIRRAVEHSRPWSVWIASDTSAFHFLATSLKSWWRNDQCLLLLRPAEGPRRRLLDALFRQVLAAGDGVQLLPPAELVEVMAAPNREDLFIGGVVDKADKAVILYRGNLKSLLLPLEWFRPRSGSLELDSSRFRVTDFGHTVAFGDYEVAGDAILYEFDEKYRRRTKKRRLAEDPSFGSALRRLRLQKGLGRDSFPGITAKEISRIERGEVKKPRRRTLEILGKRLGVPPEKIETF